MTAHHYARVSSDTKAFDVWYGKPSQPTTNPTWYPVYEMYDHDFLTVTVSSAPGAANTSYSWSVTGSITRLSTTPNNNCLVRAMSLGTGYFYVTSQNSCGTSPQGGGEVNVVEPGDGQQLSINPNPASEEIQISILGGEMEKLTKSTRVNEEIASFPFVIINSVGVETYIGTIKGQTAKVNITDWTAGIYFLIYNQNGKKLQKAFIVEE